MGHEYKPRSAWLQIQLSWAAFKKSILFYSWVELELFAPTKYSWQFIFTKPVLQQFVIQTCCPWRCWSHWLWMCYGQKWAVLSAVLSGRRRFLDGKTGSLQPPREWEEREKGKPTPTPKKGEKMAAGRKPGHTGLSVWGPHSPKPWWGSLGGVRLGTGSRRFKLFTDCWMIGSWE